MPLRKVLNTLKYGGVRHPPGAVLDLPDADLALLPEGTVGPVDVVVPTVVTRVTARTGRGRHPDPPPVVAVTPMDAEGVKQTVEREILPLVAGAAAGEQAAAAFAAEQSHGAAEHGESRVPSPEHTDHRQGPVDVPPDRHPLTAGPPLQTTSSEADTKGT